MPLFQYSHKRHNERVPVNVHGHLHVLLVVPILSLLLLDSGCLAFSFAGFSFNHHSHARVFGTSKTTVRKSISTTASTSTSTWTATTTSTSTCPAVTTVELPFCEYYTPPPSTTNANANTNTPVLLLHGLLGSKRNFASLAKSLGNQLETKRRILAVDLRNHGDVLPQNWQDDMSYTSMAQDVVAFLERHELQQVILVGHSMGGKVAQTLALTRPELVQGLVVLDMAPVAYQPQEPHWKAVTSIIQTLQSLPPPLNNNNHEQQQQQQQQHTKQSVDKHLQSTIPDPALRGFCLLNWDAKNHQWAIPMDKIAHALPILAAFDIQTNNQEHHGGVNGESSSSSSPQYHGDVFFIHGGQSKFVRHAHMETIAQYFPNHMLTTIRGAGHWVHAEAPDDTLALLKRYLDR
jgi:esterase